MASKQDNLKASPGLVRRLLRENRTMGLQLAAHEFRRMLMGSFPVNQRPRIFTRLPQSRLCLRLKKGSPTTGYFTDSRICFLYFCFHLLLRFARMLNQKNCGCSRS